MICVAESLERTSLRPGLCPALILVDMINGFTDPQSPLGSHCDSVVEANRTLLQRFRGKNWPVFYTTVVYDSEDQARVFRERLPALNILQRGSHWVEVDARPGAHQLAGAQGDSQRGSLEGGASAPPRSAYAAFD